MASLADKLSDLANVAPVFEDPEDDLSDLTLAKLAHRGDDKDDFSKLGSHIKRSALRTKSAKLLSEEDNKYVGKNISRQKLNDNFKEQKLNTKALHALKKRIDNFSIDEEDFGIQKTKTKRKANGYVKNKVQSMSLTESGSDDNEDDDDEIENDQNDQNDDNDDNDMYNVEDDDNELKTAEKVYRSILKNAVNQFNRLSSDDNEDEDDDQETDFSKDFLLEQKKSDTGRGKQDEFSFTDDGDYGKYGNDEDEDMDDDDEEDYDGSEGEDDDDEDEEIDSDEDYESENKMTKTVIEKDGIKQFSSDSSNEDVEKGKAAKNQLAIWDGLLESRIKLQKTVSSINQLPQPSIWSLFTELGGDDFNNLATDAQYELRALLDKLVQLQTILLLQNPTTKKIVTEQDQETVVIPPSTKGRPVTSVSPEDDEEITSDEEDGGEKKETAPQVTLPAKRKIPLDEYPEFLAKRHTDFLPFRNETINKWNSKTQLVSGKIKSKGFSAFNQSALKQIDQILGNKERLIKRTQLKRNDYRVLGTTQEEKPEDQLPTDEVQDEKPLQSAINDYDPEIFDDSDFYHHMLREFIDRKSSEINDPLALGRQWLEVQKSRTKVKRNVDTKASKGRKLRYNVHPKLVNFMAPVDHTAWNDDAKDDLYRSLFGQKVTLPAEVS